MTKALRQLFRLFQIYLIITKYGLDRVILPKNHPAHFLTYLNPWNWGRFKTQPKEIRIALEKLGPIFIKFGQMLSTRGDIIPTDIVDELSKLQDQVPPFPFIEVKKILEKSYGVLLDQLFESLDPIPLASASIAQVHIARLKNHQQVVIKVLRPNIQKIIKHDVGLLYALAKFLQHFLPKESGLHLSSLVSEFKQTLFDELDLVREGANASELRRHFLYSDSLYIPRIYWEYTHKNVLVMEKIQGIPIDDLPALKAAAVDLKQIAVDGIELFFTQVFRDSFFHADLHPGNIFISVQSGRPHYIFVDFGITGTLDVRDQYYIAENLMAFLNRDYRRVALLHRESGWLGETTDIRQFESSLRTACEPIFEKALKDISIAHILIRLFQTARRFNIEIQPQLLLLQKTLLNLEGITRQLCPTLDFWETSRPFLEYWMKQKHHPLYLLKKMKNRFPYWLESFLESTDARQIYAMMSDKAFPIGRTKPQKEKPRENPIPYLLISIGFLLGGLCMAIALHIMK